MTILGKATKAQRMARARKLLTMVSDFMTLSGPLLKLWREETQRVDGKEVKSCFREEHGTYDPVLAVCLWQRDQDHEKK